MKTTGILALIAASLLAFVFIVERFQPNTRQATEARYPSLEVDAAYSIEIARPDTSVILEKVASQWLITNPISDRADPSATNDWLQTLNDIQVIDIIDSSELETATVNPSELGLTAEDAIKVTIKREAAAPLTFLIGATGAFGNSTYISFPDNSQYPHIYLVEGNLHALAAGPIDNLRDTAIFDFPFADARHVSLTDSPNNVSLNRSSPGSLWHVKYPFAARAHQDQILTFLDPFWNVRAQSVQTDIGAPTPGDHLATLAVDPFPGTNGERTTVSIYGPPEGSPLDLLVLKLNTRPHALLLAAREDLPRFLDTPAEEFRDPHPTRIPLREVQHITVQSPTDPEFHLLRSEKDPQFWRLSRRGDMRHLEPANTERVGKFLKELASAEAVEIIDIEPEDLVDYGLETPAAVVHFIAFGLPESGDAANWLTDPSGDSAAVFDLALGRVLIEDFFGDEEQVFARFNDEPSVSKIDPEFLSLLPTQAPRWRGLGIIAFNPIQFRSLSAQLNSSPAQTLSHDFAQNRWLLTAEDAEHNVAPDKAESLVTSLSNLTAYDWLAAGADAYEALSHPELTLSLTLEVPNEVTGGLTEETVSILFAPVPPAKTDLPSYPTDPAFYYGRVGASPDVFLIESTTVRQIIDALPEATSAP
ncbi:MAG: DUF4340 domain-containing protein [Verrucomicrobiota bacterium]